MPIRVVVEPPTLFVETGVTGVQDPLARERLWAELTALEPTEPETELSPPASTELSLGDSATVSMNAAPSCPRWGVFEITLDGPDTGNPFVDVELSARFTDGSHSLVAGGFYDGNGRHLVRFMPPTEGRWTFHTESNAAHLHGLHGSFESTPAAPGVHGPVQVADTYHFAYTDGTRYQPVGTTAYAWTHQHESVEERTLQTLANSPFNKLRMCVLPKSFMFNENEPTRYPFPRSANDGWDTTRFNPDFFRHLERRIAQLGDLNIEVDLILLHPYDRWGFSTLPHSAHQRLVRYVVRRLSAYRNIWWSMANEYDLLPTYTTQDWENLARVVKDNDPVGHLLSIHNWVYHYDQTRPWITHCSIQAGGGNNTPETTSALRRQFHKPIIFDECGYEGDLDQGWGNLTANEFVRRCWAAAIRGGYVAHGETYVNDRDEIFWSKGGELIGESPARMQFLASIIADSPTGTMDPIQFGPFNWDVPYAGVENSYYVAYFGSSQPRYRNVRLPDGQSYHVDVIDTWNMTSTRLEGTYSGTFRITLPAQPDMALRAIRVHDV